MIGVGKPPMSPGALGSPALEGFVWIVTDDGFVAGTIAGSRWADAGAEERRALERACYVRLVVEWAEELG